MGARQQSLKCDYQISQESIIFPFHGVRGKQPQDLAYDWHSKEERNTIIQGDGPRDVPRMRRLNGLGGVIRSHIVM